MERFGTARKAVLRAGETLRGSRLGGDEVRFKSGHQDLVTYYDRLIERQLREAILGAFPEDAVVGEEYPAASGSDGVVWYIDPIDGTTNFVNRRRDYAVSVGCWAGNEPLFGLVLDVERGELYHARNGGGAWRNSERLRVSARCELSEMLLYTPGVLYSFFERGGHREGMLRLARAVRGVRCLGSVAVELCELAAGEADVFAAFRSSPWDHNAARIILSEAGGACCTVDGSPLPQNQNTTILAANSPASLKKVLALLNGE